MQSTHTHTLPRPHFYIYIFAFVTFALWLCDRHLASRSDFVSVLLPVFVFLFHILDQRQVLNICYVCSKCVWDEKESEREEDARFTHFIANRKRLFSPLKKMVCAATSQTDFERARGELAIDQCNIVQFFHSKCSFFTLKNLTLIIDSVHIWHNAEKNILFSGLISLWPRKNAKNKN